MTEPSTGTVEKVEFTHGSAGNQWTTIDGVRFATWWDMRTHAVREGARVRFQPYRAKLWSTDAHAIDCATIYEVLPTGSASPNAETQPGATPA